MKRRQTHSSTSGEREQGYRQGTRQVVTSLSVVSPSAPSASNGHIPLPLATARHLIERTIMPLPLAHGVKKPGRAKWEDERYTATDLSMFTADMGVGMRLGHITADDGTVLTDRFVDVDLDCPEAVRIAPYILPPTDMKWGRASNPRSHYGYRLVSLEGAKTIQDFVDPLHPKHPRTGKPDASICELRFSGQTVAPGSVNTEDGHPEVVRWEEDGAGFPAEVSFEELARRVTILFATALLARYWRDGIRHLASLPLAGMLCRGGMAEADATEFMRLVCIGACESADDTANRLKSVTDTYAAAADGKPYTARPTLEDYLDEKIVRIVRKRLNLHNRHASSGAIFGADGIALSDAGNAKRFAERYGQSYHYATDLNLWLHWNGVRWAADDKGHVQERIKSLAADLFADSLEIKDSAQQEIQQRWARQSGMGGHIAQTMRLATTEGEIPVVAKELDSDPTLLALPNGYYNLATDAMEAISQDALVSKVCAAPYIASARHDLWDWALHKFLPDAKEQKDLQIAVAYCLSGRAKEHTFFAVGNSKSGKSTIFNAIRNALGHYALWVGIDAFLAGKYGDAGRPREDLVAMLGKRLIVASEANQNTRINAAFLKRVTGNDGLSLRGLYGKQFEATPVFGLWLLVNDLPKLPADDDAVWERVHVFRFRQYIPPNERDEVKRDQTTDPAITGSAIIAWLLDGWRSLRDELGGKLWLPTTIQETKEYRTGEDVMAQFIAECCYEGPEHSCTAADLKAAFRAFLAAEGIHEQYTDRRIALALSKRGYEPFHSSGRRWKGVGVNLFHGVDR